MIIIKNVGYSFMISFFKPEYPNSDFYIHICLSRPKPQIFNYLYYFDVEIKHNQLTLHCSESAGILIKIPKEFLSHLMGELYFQPEFWSEFLKNFKVIWCICHILIKIPKEFRSHLMG